MTKHHDIAERLLEEAKKMPDRLKAKRQAFNLTPPELSKKSGVYRESIINPDGTRRIYLHGTENLCKIATALNTTPAYLEYGSFAISAFNEDLLELTLRIQNLGFEQQKDFIDQANQGLDKPTD